MLLEKDPSKSYPTNKKQSDNASTAFSSPGIFLEETKKQEGPGLDPSGAPGALQKESHKRITDEQPGITEGQPGNNKRTARKSLGITVIVE